MGQSPKPGGAGPGAGGRSLLVGAPGAGRRHLWMQRRMKPEKTEKSERQTHVRAGARQWTFCPKAEERQQGGSRAVIPTAGARGQQHEAWPQGTGPPAPGTAPGAPIPPAGSSKGPGAVEAARHAPAEGTWWPRRYPATWFPTFLVENVVPSSRANNRVRGIYR